MRKFWLPALLVTALLLMSAACQTSAPAPTPTPVPPTPTPAPTATPTPSGAATPSGVAIEVPEQFKPVIAAMSNIKSVKFKMGPEITQNGTPVPVPELMGEFSGEVDLANHRSYMKIGEMETIIIGNVTYTRFSKDVDWMKTETQPGESPEADFAPGEEDFSKLAEIKETGTESCDSGMCRVITAVTTQDTDQSTLKFWIGVSDSLIYKVRVEQTDMEGVHTVVTFEYYDYNKPVTIEAPIP